MASGCTSSGGSRRGLISCLHSLNCRAEDAPLLPDRDLPRAICKLMYGFYEEAFDRLPTESEAMPDLLGLLTTGGFCLGLLDPVSNIILNTIALLPKDATSSSSPAAVTASSAAKRPKPSPGTDAWHDIVCRSYQSLLRFLTTYFGCLTREQAIRYLYKAEANLLLAVMLVEHDLYYAEAEAVDPESDRTKAALECAATTDGHPSPTTLTKLMSIRLKQEDFELLQKHFAGDGGRGHSPLTAEQVREIHRVVHAMMRPMFFVKVAHTKQGLDTHVCRNMNVVWSQTPSTTTTKADGRVIESTSFTWAGTPISSLQSGLPNRLQDCLRIADGQKHILKTPCGGDDAPCDYSESLSMFLHATIHNMYVNVLKLLPTPSGSLMRSILKAGHCYGSCDPLSNIILNSILYDVCASSTQLPEFAKYNDILDPRAFLRPVVRSLKGLVNLALFADPQSSVACAMKKLCIAKCDMLSSAEEMTEKNHFHEAAVAAGHPVPLQMAELHRKLLLMPNERRELLSLITEAQTSGRVLNVDHIRFRMTSLSSSFEKSKAKTCGTVQVPQLCEHALSVVLKARSNYERRRSWLRSEIEQLLQDYTDQHFYGPKYTLDIIAGVEASNQDHPPYEDMRYHINFLATSDLKLQRTLFFAELGSSHKPEADFCCPLPNAYAGRCYYDKHIARKIVYPDDAKYFSDDITSGGTFYVDDMREMDLVYFSSDLDVELAENLNMLPSSEFDPDEFE